MTSVASHSDKGYKAIAKQFQIHRNTVRRIVYNWRDFNTDTNLPRSGRSSKFSPRSDNCSEKKTRSYIMLPTDPCNVNVHDSTIRKWPQVCKTASERTTNVLEQYLLYRSRRRCSFIVFGTTFGKNKPSLQYHRNHLTPTVKHVIWARYAAVGRGNILTHRSTPLYTRIFVRRTFDLSSSVNWIKNGSRNRAMTQSTPAN